MNEKIIEILAEIRPEFDFESEQSNFIAKGMLDSFDIVSIVVDLEVAFDIKISGSLILPENFASIAAIAHLIQNSKDASQV